jgi:putative ABC transport system permease protein
MKFLPLIWASMWRKPVRTALTTLALVIAFVLFGLLQGINASFDAFRASARMDGIWVNSRYGAPLPLAYKQEIAAMPAVKSVVAASFMNGTVNGDPKRHMGMAFAEDGFFDFFSWLDVTPALVAELRSKRTGIAVGKATADRLGLKAGDRIILKSNGVKKDGGKDWELEVVAVVERKDVAAAAGMVVGNFEYMNEALAAGTDMVSQFLVTVSDPEQAVATAKAIDERYLNSGAPVRTVVDKVSAEQGYQDDSTPTMVNAIIVSTLFSLLVMTSNSLMQAFREQIPEFGTLKALGFSDRRVFALVLIEAWVLCVTGGAIGLAIAYVLAPAAQRTISGLNGAAIMVSWTVFVQGLLIATLVALISAAVPAFRAKRMQIVEALAVR